MNDDLDSVLAHYGVPGMKWGVRRERKKSGYEIDKASGGVKVPTRTLEDGSKQRLSPSRKPATDEAVKRHVTGAIIKRDGIDAVSNKELQDYLNRVNLEQQYSKLVAGSTPQKSAGRKFVETLVKNEMQSVVLKGKPGPLTGMILGSKYTGKHRSKKG